MSSRRIQLSADLADLRVQVRESSSSIPIALHDDLHDVADVMESSVREAELQKAADLFKVAALALEAETRLMAHARDGDRAELEDFAIKLACTVSEVLVGTVIDEDRHDVRAIVTKVLEEALPDRTDEEVVLTGHPDDMARLGTGYETSGSVPDLRLVSDPSHARGEFRVRAGEVEFYSGIQERLAGIRDRLLVENKDRV